LAFVFAAGGALAATPVIKKTFSLFFYPKKISKSAGRSAGASVFLPKPRL
jgi:hypothetical protein